MLNSILYSDPKERRVIQTVLSNFSFRWIPFSFEPKADDELCVGLLAKPMKTELCIIITEQVEQEKIKQDLVISKSLEI